MEGWKGLKHGIKQSPADECSSPTNPQTSVTKSPFKVHSSRKKSSGWEPFLLIPIMGLPPLPPQKRKEKNFRQLNCYYKLWIIIFGSFFAPSLCHLPPKSDLPLAGARDGEERTGRP